MTMKTKSRRRKRNGVGKKTGIKKKYYRRRNTDVEKLLNWDTAAAVKANEFRLVRDKKELKRGRELYAHLFADSAIPTDAVHFWKLVKNSPARFSLGNHRRVYLKAVVAAYAILEHIAKHQTSFTQHINIMGELTSNRPTSRHAVPVKMALQLVIDYSHSDNDDDKPRTDYKRLSRDALAVQWLIGEEIPACDVIAHQKRHGGGLDRWSRCANKSGDETSEIAHAKALAAIEARTEKKSTEMNHYYDDSEPGEKPFENIPVTERQICSYFAQKYEPCAGESLILELVGSVKTPHVRFGRKRLIGGKKVPGRNRIEVAKTVGKLFDEDTEE